MGADRLDVSAREGRYEGDWLVCPCGRKLGVGITAYADGARVGPCKGCRRWVRVPKRPKAVTRRAG